MKIPIELSARHIHLCKDDLEILFGKDYSLTVLKNISQPGQFAAKETVNISNKTNTISNVRIVGPLRDESQVEISKSDAYALKINPPIRISGEIENTPGITITGPSGEVILQKGVIIAKRHLHLSEEEAKKMNLNHKDNISINIFGERSLIFNEVIIRSRKGIDKMAFHLDTDEANAANVISGDYGEINE